MDFTKEKRKFYSIRRGFTIVELLMVIAVIGVLAGLVLVNYPASRKRARDTQRISDIKQYQIGMELYASRNDGQYFNATSQPNNHCGPGKELDMIDYCPPDPLDPAQEYEFDTTLTEYVLWATLEVPDSDGNTRYFVACSTGVSGTTINPPSGSSCPL